MQACSFLFIYRKTRIFKRREPKSKGRVHSKYIGGIKKMSKQQIEPPQTYIQNPLLLTNSQQINKI